MKVNIEIGEWAAKHTQTGTFLLEVPSGATVDDVIAMLGLPPGEVGLAAVAGKHVARGHALKGGDNIKLFPCIVGG